LFDKNLESGLFYLLVLRFLALLTSFLRNRYVFSLRSYVTDVYAHGLSTNKVVCARRMWNTYGLKLSFLDSFSE